MLVRKGIWMLIALMLSLLLVGCQNRQEAPLPAPIQQLRGQLSEELEIPEDAVEIVSYEQEDWPDACLGLAEEGEVCAQVITPGYQVTVEVQGEEYVFRTNEDATVVRLVEEE
ncbi:MAG: hypothetical protein ACLFU8_04735 [Anaerolineales bacterium]